MDCTELDELIREGSLEGLSPAAQRALDAHLHVCARCRERIHSDLFAAPIQPPSDLLDSILQETSGPACGRAAELLAARLDGELGGLDAELVNVHADGCSDCDALRAAFSGLMADLPAMRELDPGLGFAERVLARISPATHALPADGRFRRFWNRLVERPRIAWEAAYVGAMLFWVVLGAPLSAWVDDAPELRAFLPDLTPTREAMSALHDPISTASRRAWSSAHEGWSSSLSRLESDLEQRSARTDPPRRQLQKHGSQLREALGSLDIREGQQAAKAITGDAREIVSRFIQGDESEPQE